MDPTFDQYKLNDNEIKKFGDDGNGLAYVRVRDTSTGQNYLNNKYASSDIQSGTTSYFGFLAVDGSWYIMKKTLTEIRYIKGDSDYATNWGNRATLSYDYFDTVFG